MSDYGYREAYRCPKHDGHWVRSDNPLDTGRCEFCRQFVVFVTSGGKHGEMQGWRTATRAQAQRWTRQRRERPAPGLCWP